MGTVWRLDVRTSNKFYEFKMAEKIQMQIRCKYDAHTETIGRLQDPYVYTDTLL